LIKIELKEQLNDMEALKTEAESQLEQIQEKYYALVKKTQKMEMQVSQLKTKVLLPKKPESTPTPAEKESIVPKTPVAAPAPAVSALEGGAKRKSPDRDDDGRKRIRPFMDITVTDQRPPIASKPKAKVEAKPVEEVAEHEPLQAQKESTLSSEDLFSKQPPSQRRYTRSTQATTKVDEGSQDENCKVQ